MVLKARRVGLAQEQSVDKGVSRGFLSKVCLQSFDRQRVPSAPPPAKRGDLSFLSFDRIYDLH